jgi:hypothetical protein
LAAALLSGAASGLVGEAAYNHFQPSDAASGQRFDFTRLNVEQAQANARNGAMVYGALGGLLGLGLGLAGGLSRRSLGAAVTGAAVGLMLGAAAGGLPPFAVMPWYAGHRADEPSATTLLPILFHVALWCLLGAAAGLAYGLGRDGPRPARLFHGALGGLIGAAVGALVYEVVGALVFWDARTNETFAATTAARALAHVCVAVFVALGAVLGLEPRGHRAKRVVADHPLSG